MKLRFVPKATGLRNKQQKVTLRTKPEWSSICWLESRHPGSRGLCVRPAQEQHVGHIWGAVPLELITK